MDLTASRIRRRKILPPLTAWHAQLRAPARLCSCCFVARLLFWNCGSRCRRCCSLSLPMLRVSISTPRKVMRWLGPTTLCQLMLTPNILSRLIKHIDVSWHSFDFATNKKSSVYASCHICHSYASHAPSDCLRQSENVRALYCYRRVAYCQRKSRLFSAFKLPRQSSHTVHVVVWTDTNRSVSRPKVHLSAPVSGFAHGRLSLKCKT